MNESQKTKWQEQAEEILREQYPGDELKQLLDEAQRLIDFAQEVEQPSGNAGKVVATILKAASEELYPLAAVYAGFQLGVAWGKYQNANRA